MIKVEVRLFASFRQGREKTQVIEVEEGSTMLDIIKHLGIDEKEVAIKLLNGRDGPIDRKVEDGDILSLFPPIGGG